MDKKIIDEILEEVKYKVHDIFEKNLLFGFVCGGFSKGYADHNHDVDIFICLENMPDKDTEKKYLDWYFDLHKRYKIKADYDYPGEIVTYTNLIETLSILKNLKLTLKIAEIKVKKSIIWADMLTSVTKAENGSRLDLLYEIKKEYEDYPEKWKKEVLALITDEEKELWKDKSHLLIMEHFMQYPKHDGKKLDKIYNLTKS
ncbi:MAG: hypothetical protein KBC33_03400 [Candidatus Pacebacteria bacterium]|nr:hypothetical protein [Candidatus Paceibacterota bacterium]